ncbi:MAG: hypothetical protein AB2A00_36705 [Myxococcota bacterium]
MRLHRWLLGLSVGAALALSACKKEPATSSTDAGVKSGVSVGAPQKIPLTNATLRLARGWIPERLDGADTPLPDTPTPGMIDLAETVEVWRASIPSPTGRVDPFLLVTVDRRLPKGTTASQYLSALRTEQSKQAGTKVTHLETERVERDGRPGFSLRDSMNVPTAAGGGTPLHQVARIFVDGGAGITVTAMMLEDDKPALDAAIRAMMESIKFTTPAPKDNAAP